MLALTGLFALALALLTGSTPIAVLVVALAVAGIVLLLRDWRAGESTPSAVEETEPAAQDNPVRPDDFSPDISTDPDGPSANARAD